MSSLVWIGLVAALLGALVMHLLSLYPGYVLISVGDLAIEFGLWFGLSGLLLLAVLLWLCAKSLIWLLGALNRSISWANRRQLSKTKRRTQSGLLHFIQGNWQAAKQDLLSSIKHVDQPLLHYLAAAKSAEQLGNAEEQQQLLHQAAQILPPSDQGLTLAQAHMHHTHGQSAKALAILGAMGDPARQSPAVLHLYRQIYEQQQRWAELLALLPSLKKTAAMEDAAFLALQQKACLGHLNAGAKGLTTARDVTALWQSLPKIVRKAPALIAVYGELLHRCQQDAVAEALLRKTLDKHWHPQLVAVYATLNIDPKLQLKHAQRWLQRHPEDALLNCALGDICQRNALWQQAQSYYEKSLATDEQLHTYQRLAALFDRLGDSQNSFTLHKKALNFACGAQAL